jgi:hypothetical protein
VILAGFVDLQDSFAKKKYVFFSHAKIKSGTTTV